MSEPKYLEVSATEKPELEKGESGLSSANVGTEARESVSAKETNVGINLTNQKGTPIGNTEKRGLSVSNEKHGMTYVNDTNAKGNAPRILDDKKRRVIVNTITVDEVKKLIKLLGGSASGKIGFDAVVVEELPDVGESGVIYLIENQGEAPNVYDEYIWIKSENKFEMIGTTEVDLTDYYTKEESDAKYVDLDSSQNVPGVKTFSNDGIGIGTLGTIKFVGQLLCIRFDNQTKLSFERNQVNIYQNLVPSSNNSVDVGSNSNKIKDLHIEGKIKDGTNEVSVKDIIDYQTIKKISYADYQALTTEQRQALLDTGVQIIGTLSMNVGGQTIVNPYLYPRRNFGTYSQGVCIGGSTSGRPLIGTYEQIHSASTLTTKLCISLVDDNTIISKLNGKAISFPTANTSPQVPVIAPNGGALSWKNLFSPESVSISDGGTISDDTLKELIIGHYPIVLNGYTGYYSCDDGTNYQYASTMYDASTNSIHYNVITINKSTWVVTFHTKNIAL